MSAMQPVMRAAQATSIPFVRLDNSDPALFEELMAAVERVARRAAFTLGDEVESFEARLRRLLRGRRGRRRRLRAPTRSSSRCGRWGSGPATR